MTTGELGRQAPARAPDLPAAARVMDARDAALIVAHPGHELRVHHWVRLARPRVLVLTDGSGAGRTSRLASTARVLEAAGAAPGRLFGRFTDREIYQALLDRRFGLFIEIAEELADVLAGGGFRRVAGDAAEGFNPVHDACRLLIDTAVAIAGRRTGRAPENLDFLLDGPPGECPGNVRERAIRLRLDDAQLEMKIQAARSYPELAGEVEAAMKAHGLEAFRRECLRPVAAPAAEGVSGGAAGAPPPFYETFGAGRVAAGVYRRVIRRREHLDPLAAALARHVRERAPWPRSAS